jgi:pullulanase
MYESFGSIVNKITKKVTFTLFYPDSAKAPEQYEGGGLPRIKDVFVTGSFQHPQSKNWDKQHPVKLNPAAHPKGVIYTFTSAPLPDGFYEYQYCIRFENGDIRYIYDPCAHYGGESNNNSAFVVGGEDEEVMPIMERIPYKDQIIYELMPDDFTNNFLGPGQSIFEAITTKLSYLKGLGITTIEFMPWFARIYPDDPMNDFSWGYNPAQYFSVCHKYTNNPSNETNKLVYLKRLINKCHELGLHVIMDGVFNHAETQSPSLGFPYYWLYQDPADSPYIGNFAEAAFFQDLDYANQCTLEYIRDACFYWIDVFKIDGIRFDNTAGMYHSGDRGHGIPKLLSELRGYLSNKQIKNFALILEHEWNYNSIDVTNKTGATSCWLDPFRSLCFDLLGKRPEGHPQTEPFIMRMLNSAKDFDPNRTPTTYIENHDHKRFMLKTGDRNYWYMTQPYIISLFTCSGAPLIYNGQEFGQDNDMPEYGEPGNRVIPRPVLWNLKDDSQGQQLMSFYVRMIKIRKEHPGLRSPNFHPQKWDDGWMFPDPDGFGIDRNQNIVIYHRWGYTKNGKLERFYVVLNFNDKEPWETASVSFNVPDDGPWTDLISGMVKNAVNVGNDIKIFVDVPPNYGALFFKEYPA